jgi:hypothetical protein
MDVKNLQHSETEAAAPPNGPQDAAQSALPPRQRPLPSEDAPWPTPLAWNALASTLAAGG